MYCKRGSGLAYKSAGILEYSGEGYAPKVSYFYVSTTQNVLSGLKFSTNLSECIQEENNLDHEYVTNPVNDCPRVYEYTGSGATTYAFWSPTVTNKDPFPHKIDLPPGTTAVTLVSMENNNPLGSYTPIYGPFQDDQITVMVTERPQFLVLDEIITCEVPSIENINADVFSCRTVDLQ